MPIAHDRLRHWHRQAHKSLDTFLRSKNATDKETTHSLSEKLRIVREYIDRIGDAIGDDEKLRKLNFVDAACDMRGLYWDEPKTFKEREALDHAATLFQLLRRELNDTE